MSILYHSFNRSWVRHRVKVMEVGTHKGSKRNCLIRLQSGCLISTQRK